MTVQELIDILQKEVAEEDRATAQIEIWEGEQEYEIESLHGWGLSADISIHIEKTESPLIKPANFKAKHKDMVQETIDQIKKDGN